MNLVLEMQQRWRQFLHRARLKDDQEQIFAHLVESYGSSVRQYHSFPHIEKCLIALESVRAVCPEVISVEAAVWFHDVVYVPPSSVNEDLSADEADRYLRQMGLDAAKVALVHELIMDTKHQKPPRTEAGKFMVDIDLSSMGQSAEGFDEDGRNVRAEYAHVDEASYNRGRVELFGRLLARKTIYYTQVFHDRLEERARENLQRTIQRLNSSAKPAHS